MPSRLATAVDQLFLAQARQLQYTLTPEYVLGGGRVNLVGQVTDELVAKFVPYLLREWQLGLTAGARAMGRAGHPVNTRALRGEIVDEATEQVRRMLRETAKTTQDALNAKVREARRRLRAKKPKPGAMSGVTLEIQNQLRNSDRVKAITDTEVDTAKNGGRLLVIREGDAPYKRWRTVGPRICDACRRLDGKVVAVADPFYVDPRGGPYAVKMTPPFHPNCACVCEPAWRK